MQHQSHTEPQFSKQVIEMITVANEYCHTLENRTQYPREEFFLFLSRILPLLYIKGSLIPEVVVSFPEATEHYVTEEQWEILFNDLKEEFDKQDAFWSMQHGQYTDDPVKLSLSELLTDIYQDLKDFVILFQSPMSEQKINAVDEVKRLFDKRWGLNCTLALTAIHQIIVPSGTSDEADNDDNL